MITLTVVLLLMILGVLIVPLLYLVGPIVLLVFIDFLVIRKIIGLFRKNKES